MSKVVVGVSGTTCTGSIPNVSKRSLAGIDRPAGIRNTLCSGGAGGKPIAGVVRGAPEVDGPTPGTGRAIPCGPAGERPKLNRGRGPRRNEFGGAVEPGGG